jgi:cholesterol transport system auxiliary component
MSPGCFSTWLLAIACSLLSACALLSKAEPLVPRYFTPEDTSGIHEGKATVLPPGLEPRKLRLGSVRAGSQLRERIVFRNSSHELGYYEDRRWTERPEAYLRRALARTLFEQRGLVRVVSGPAPTLDIELVAFEEVRGPEHEARAQAIITLDDDRVGSFQQTVTVEQPVRSDAKADDADAAVDALAIALQECVKQIADRVIAMLVSAPAETPTRGDSPLNRRAVGVE